MCVGSGGQEAVAPLGFIHDTDKVDEGLIVLYFSVLFFPLPHPGNFSANALDYNNILNCTS